jgi:cell division protein FtsQ
MDRVLIILKWVLAILVLVVVLSFTNNRQANQFVKLNEIGIEIAADNFVNQQVVLDYLNSKNVNFDSVLVNDFQKEDLENLLLTHPNIKNVEVFTNQKGAIDFTIFQKQAIVRVKGINADYFLDSFGNRMEISSHYTPNLIVVTGDVTADKHKNIFDFVNEINESKFWNSQLTQMHLSGKEIILIPRVGGHKIYLGSFENTKQKLEELYQFYKIAMPAKGWQTYTDISLKFNNQIVCTKR